MEIDVKVFAKVDAQSDAESDYNLAKEHRGTVKKLRLEVLEEYFSESDKQKYLETYAKEYRKEVKRLIGKAKRLLIDNGYVVKERY